MDELSVAQGRVENYPQRGRSGNGADPCHERLKGFSRRRFQAATPVLIFKRAMQQPLLFAQRTEALTKVFHDRLRLLTRCSANRLPQKSDRRRDSTLAQVTLSMIKGRAVNFYRAPHTAQARAISSILPSLLIGKRERINSRNSTLSSSLNDIV